MSSERMSQAALTIFILIALIGGVWLIGKLSPQSLVRRVAGAVVVTGPVRMGEAGR